MFPIMQGARPALRAKNVQMQAATAMAPTAEAPVDQMEKMTKVARNHYDSDDIFNYCQQVCLFVCLFDY